MIGLVKIGYYEPNPRCKTIGGIKPQDRQGDHPTLSKKQAKELKKRLRLGEKRYKQQKRREVRG